MAKKLRNKFKKVEVWWHDAFSHCEHQSLDWLINEELNAGDLQKTSGFLLAENKDWIAIASTITQDNRAKCTWFIPKKWIIKRL